MLPVLPTGTSSPPFGPALAIHAGDDDLAHDRRRRRHLRADALGQHARERRQPLLHGLPGGADLGVPVELDVDDVQPRGRLAAHGLHAGRPEQGDLDRLRDQRLDFFRGQAGALGHDDDARPVEVGKHVDRQRRRQVAAVDQQRQAEDDDQHPVAQREANDGVEHGGCS